MNYITGVKRVLILPLLVIFISSCGGGGGTESSGNPPPPGPQSATISWFAVNENSDGSNCADLAGYRVYYSEQHVTKNNSQMIDVGNTTWAQINNLLIGHIYYVRVASYDTSNNESDLSTEVSKTIN